MNQYKEGKGSDVEFYLSTWNGHPYAVDRVGTSFTLERPLIGVVGGIPPEILSQLDVSGGKADGFLPRILESWPEPVEVRWNENEISLATQLAYDNQFDQLFAIPYDSENGPLFLELTDDAKEVFVQWHDDHMKEMEQGNWSPFVKGSMSKLKGYCGRLALIHGVCSDPSTTEIGVDSIQAAIQMIDYFKGQAIKVDKLFDHSTSEGKVDRCKAAIRRHLTSGGMKKRNLQRTFYGKAEIFNQALAEMSRAEIVQKDGMISLFDS
jgi:hypothetical protein